MKNTILKSTLLLFCLATLSACHHAPKEKAIECHVSPAEVFGCDLTPQDLQFHSVLDADFRGSHLFDEWMNPEVEGPNFVCVASTDTAAVATKAAEFCQNMGGEARACWQKVKGEEAFELLIIASAPLLDGTSISEATATISGWGDPQLNIVFNEVAAKEWKAITADHVGKRIAITVKDQVLSAPTIMGEIDGGKSSVVGPAEEEICALSQIFNRQQAAQ